MPIPEPKRLVPDTYTFPGFRPEPAVRGVFGDPKARVIPLKRRSKKTVCRGCGRTHSGRYDRKLRRVRELPCGDTRVYLKLEVRRVFCRRCGTVKRECLSFLVDNPLYTKRFAFYVGRHCRSAFIQDVARELHLDWHTVKALEKMRVCAPPG